MATGVGDPLPLHLGRPTAPGNERRARIIAALASDTDCSEDLAAELGTQDGVAWATETIVQAMCRPSLDFAERLAVSFARLRHRPGDPNGIVRVLQPPLSIDKLQHDLLQLNALSEEGSIGNNANELTSAYIDEIGRLSSLDREARVPVDRDRRDTLSKYYGRIIHVEPTRRQREALSAAWSRAQAEREYHQSRSGVVIVDNFLNPDALHSLRRFCTLSTVWNANRYPHGRLGALFVSGFACPLLSQIAEEVRDQLPSIIGPSYPLKQLWGYKYPPYLPGGSLHADFAAVNVNFWISPSEANRDPLTGGLIVYEADAPPDWDFELYNARPDLIEQFLLRHSFRARYIPYQENRAIIFNSDLFHRTAEVKFDEDYKTRRINITMLYGDRSADHAHANLSLRAMGLTGPSHWRSARAGRWRRP
jgi:hypothetical protein